jgi:hypothetical protein
MDSDELRSVLRGATTELEPRPGLTGDVLRGGKRRKRRRRTTVVAVVAAVAAAASVTTVATWRSASQQVQQANDPRLSQPTHGDLGTDTAFLGDVVQVWQRGLPDITGNINGKYLSAADMVDSKPHVYWAGGIKAGRYAVVLQAIRPVKDARPTVAGMVGPDPASGRLAVLGVDHPWLMTREMAYRFGPAGRYLLALDEGKPLFLSAGVGYDEAGKAQRQWQELKPADGVFRTELPEGTGAMDAKLFNSNPATGGVKEDDLVDIVNTDEAGVMSEKRRIAGMDWGREGGWDVWVGAERPVDGVRSLPIQAWNEGLQASGLLDPASPHESGGAGWYAIFAGTQGQKAVVGEYNGVQSGPSRIYTAILDAQDKVIKIVPGGPLDPGAKLPVLAPLGTLGRGVVLKGATLSYRTSADQPWQAERQDALLIPQNGGQVQVKRPDSAPMVVNLP